MGWLRLEETSKITYFQPPAIGMAVTETALWKEAATPAWHAGKKKGF